MSTTGARREALLSQFAAVLLAPGQEHIAQRLLAHLHTALNISDRLPPSQVEDRADAQLALSNSLKLRLVKDPSETGLQNFTGHVVLIDPLASIQVRRQDRRAPS